MSARLGHPSPPSAKPSRGRARTSIRALLGRPLASYQIVLGSTALLLGIGLIMVLSASSVLALQLYDNPFAIFVRQTIFAGCGLAIAFVVSRSSTRMLRRLVYPLLIITTLLIMATLIPGVGVEVQGGQRWLPVVPGFRLQPSELAKLALVLWAADLYARKQNVLSRPRHVWLPVLPVAALMSALIVAQDDLGTALILIVITLGMMWVAGIPKRYMVGIGASVAGVLVFFVATAPYRAKRMLNFIDPLANSDAEGYQSVHSMMAFATGRFFGVGLGASRQKWGTLPEAHTDFILSVIGEELGLFGTAVILALFAILTYAGIRIATRAQDPFARYAAAGITIWVVTQAAVNIGMVLGLLPVIGLPLPLLSYGGSSLITTLAAVGLLLKFAKTEPGAARTLAAKKKRRQRRRGHQNAPPELVRRGET